VRGKHSIELKRRGRQAPAQGAAPGQIRGGEKGKGYFQGLNHGPPPTAKEKITVKTVAQMTSREARTQIGFSPRNP